MLSIRGSFITRSQCSKIALKIVTREKLVLYELINYC